MLNLLTRFMLKLKSKVDSKSEALNQDSSKTSIYTDLLPTDDADKDGHYGEALSFALESDEIKNIALTGPYGSGKSSIIKTFERKNDKYSFLNISLATFDDNNQDPEKEDNQTLEGEGNQTPKKSSHEASGKNNLLVEKSILQQMIYGASGDNLPYSRFRKILKPKHSKRKALITLTALVSMFVVYKKFDLFLNFDLNNGWPSEFDNNIFTLILFSIISFTSSIYIVSNFYKSTFRSQFKKINLTTMEVEKGSLDNESLLNKNLDEIIYFFKETHYDLVVIEDLDRFGSPEIFIKLREINKLINDSFVPEKRKNKKKKVQFLYALKDDMFLHKDRTKFFDFIIPVLPVVNTSNSLNKIVEILKNTPHQGYFEKAEPNQFLREISFFLDDLRLIKNIFNEFNVYFNKLDTSSGESRKINKTKLLAMLIYKNSYPNDFENLHKGKGVFLSIVSSKKLLIDQERKNIDLEIKELKKQLVNASKEKIKSEEELIEVYVGKIIKRNKSNLVGIKSDGGVFKVNEIDDVEKINKIVLSKNLGFEFYRGSGYSNHWVNNVPDFFNEEEREIEKRISNIKMKSNKNQIEIKRELKLKQKQKEKLVFKTLKEVISNDDIEAKCSKNSITEYQLLQYLIKNSHLDEDYHLYTSNFYEGLMTVKDNKYIVTMLSNNEIELTQTLDTPREVYFQMRDEHFASKYILNTQLIDFIMTDSRVGSEHLESTLTYLSENMSTLDEFLVHYFGSGESIEAFIKKLFSKHPTTIHSCLELSCFDELVTYILRFVDLTKIKEEIVNSDELSNYLNENVHTIYDSTLTPPDDYQALIDLKVKAEDVSLFIDNQELVDYVRGNNLYKISQNNLITLMENAIPKSEHEKIHTQNYTTILEVGDLSISDYIDKNLNTYIQDIFFGLPNNKQESEQVLKGLLGREEIDLETKEKIIVSQNCVFDSFEGIDQRLWKCIILNYKIKPYWKNVSAYLETFNEKNESEGLTEFLESHVDELDSTSIREVFTDKDEKEKKNLSRYIFDNDELTVGYYSRFIKKIPYYYSEFPKVSKEKIKILITNRAVRLKQSNFLELEDSQLIALFIKHNLSEYFKDPESYPLSAVVLKILLGSSEQALDSSKKISLCDCINTEETEFDSELSDMIAIVLAHDSKEYSFNDEVLFLKVIKTAKNLENRLTLLIKCLPSIDEGTCMELLATFPHPYVRIAKYGKRPNLEDSPLNMALSDTLKSKGFIKNVIPKKNNKIQIFTKD